MPETEITQIANGAIEQNINTLRNRVNQLGVAEIIQRQVQTAWSCSCRVQDTAEAAHDRRHRHPEYRAVVEGNAQDAINPAASRRRRRCTSVVTAWARCC